METLLLALICIFTISGLLGLVTNIIQIILVCYKKIHKSSVFGITITSLAAADIIVSIVLLLRGVSYLAFSITKNWTDLSLILKYADIGIVFSLMSSFAHVSFIAIIRLIATLYPLRTQYIITRRKCYVVLASLWILSIIFSAVASKFMVSSRMFFVLSLLAFASSVTLIVAYTFICYKIITRYNNRIRPNIAELRIGEFYCIQLLSLSPLLHASYLKQSVIPSSTQRL